MRAAVSTEARFQRTPDGRVWTPSSYPYTFWRRYLDVFDAVTVLARVRDIPAPEPGWVRVDGDQVDVFALPHYQGPAGLALRALPIVRRLRAAPLGSSALILRLPSPIAALVPLGRRPYALEVVGDPHDVFAPGAVDHPLRALFRWALARHLRDECARAPAVAYVTRQALQARYPAAQAACTAVYSSVELPAEAFAAAPRAEAPQSGPVRLVAIGALDVPYKGVDILLDALAICRQSGLGFHLAYLGQGRLLPDLQAQALRLALPVDFLGEVPSGEPVRAHLRAADLFVTATRTEGLPRAMLEAMALGLPCIGTRVGGIPELLGPADMVPPGDAAALAHKLKELAADPARLARMSARNLAAAADYRDDVLRAARNDFYTHLREITARWLSR